MPNSTSLRPAVFRLLAVGALALALLSVNPAITSIAPAHAADATAPTAQPTSDRVQTAAQRRAMLRLKTWRAFKIAQRQKGDPYRYGASGPSAFDCSGLTSYVYKRAGLSLPRTSSAQAGKVRHISRSRLKRGDLVFVHSGGRVYHVGLFAGKKDGRYYMLHAGRTGTRVDVDPIWTNSWYGGTLRR